MLDDTAYLCACAFGTPVRIVLFFISEFNVGVRINFVIRLRRNFAEQHGTKKSAFTIEKCDFMTVFGGY